MVHHSRPGGSLSDAPELSGSPTMPRLSGGGVWTSQIPPALRSHLNDPKFFMRRRHWIWRKGSPDIELTVWAALFSSLQLCLNAVSNTLPARWEISSNFPVAECQSVVPFPTRSEDALLLRKGPIWSQFHFLMLYINTAIKSNDMQIKKIMASYGVWAVAMNHPEARTQPRLSGSRVPT